MSAERELIETPYYSPSLAKADLFPAEIGLDQSVYQICSAATYVAAMQSSDNAIH